MGPPPARRANRLAPPLGLGDHRGAKLRDVVRGDAPERHPTERRENMPVERRAVTLDRARLEVGHPAAQPRLGVVGERLEPGAAERVLPARDFRAPRAQHRLGRLAVGTDDLAEAVARVVRVVDGVGRATLAGALVDAHQRSSRAWSPRVVVRNDARYATSADWTSALMLRCSWAACCFTHTTSESGRYTCIGRTGSASDPARRGVLLMRLTSEAQYTSLHGIMQSSKWALDGRRSAGRAGHGFPAGSGLPVPRR